MSYTAQNTELQNLSKITLLHVDFDINNVNIFLFVLHFFFTNFKIILKIDYLLALRLKFINMEFTAVRIAWLAKMGKICSSYKKVLLGTKKFVAGG